MATATQHDNLALVVPQQAVERLELARRTVAKDATAEEFDLFVYDCQRRGVHPLDRLIHFTKRSGKYTPITSIDFMRTRAAETGEYAGNDDPVFVYAESQPQAPIQATVTVWRIVHGVRCNFTATARWREYFPGDAQGWAWKKMPHIMLGKCAEALALRKAFPQQLAGLYAAEEMDQAGGGTGQQRHDANKPQRVSGKLWAYVEKEMCQVAVIGESQRKNTKVIVTDGGHDSLLMQLSSYEDKRDVEVEVVPKRSSAGKEYLELARILTINGKSYEEGALLESIKVAEAKKLPTHELGVTNKDVEIPGVFDGERKPIATDDDITF